jgi:hypothetical protein
MESMVPWLLLVIAGLIVLCAVMHSRMRETESATRGQQSVITDELRDAEAALVSALERLRRMDQELSERERDLSHSYREPPPAPVETPRLRPAPATDEPTGRLTGAVPPIERPPVRQPSARRDAEPLSSDPCAGGGSLFSTGSSGRPSAKRNAGPAPKTSWRTQAIQLSRRGLSALEIARELGLPVGEVELVLALEGG